MPIGSNLSFGGSANTASLTDKAAQFVSEMQSKLKRRNAIPHKVTNKLGHKFDAIILTEPTFCPQCDQLIWGLVGQSCKLCKLVSHRKCLSSIESRCVKAQYQDVDSRQSCHINPHRFKSRYFMTPTCCRHCGTLIKNLITPQGVECSCGFTVHDDCENLVGHECNQNFRRYQGSVIKCIGETISTASRRQNESAKLSRIKIEDFELVSLLGQGSFSKVYLARLKDSEHEFAIKVIKKSNLELSSDPDSAFTELKTLKLGKLYPFLTIVHCCFQSQERLYFVMEHVVGRDLFYHLTRARKFTEAQTKFYAAEIALALRFLHDQQIIYRDLKLDNVILDKEGHCKLLDFGMSKELCKTANMRTRTFCGTPSYISPEMIQARDYDYDYDYSVDWWTFGVLMYEMLMGCSPFEAQSDEQLYIMILKEDVHYPKSLGLRSRSILESLLTKNPNERLGCQGTEQPIFDHKFFLFETEDGFELFQWDRIEKKAIRPPYIPTEDETTSRSTEEQIVLTPISPYRVRNFPQNEFDKFSYYSSSFRVMAGLP